MPPKKSAKQAPSGTAAAATSPFITRLTRQQLERLQQEISSKKSEQSEIMQQMNRWRIQWEEETAENEATETEDELRLDPPKAIDGRAENQEAEEEDLDGPPPNRTGGPFVTFAMITTEVVERNFELTWAYGQSYAPNRTYRSGAPAAANCDDFNIRDVFPDGVPVRAVSDYVPTGADSSQSSGDDPEFVGAAFSQCVI